MLYHVCPPVRKIIHELKLMDYLHVQPDNPWYNYNIRLMYSRSLVLRLIYRCMVVLVSFFRNLHDVKMITKRFFESLYMFVISNSSVSIYKRTLIGPQGKRHSKWRFTVGPIHVVASVCLHAE